MKVNRLLQKTQNGEGWEIVPICVYEPGISLLTINNTDVSLVFEVKTVTHLQSSRGHFYPH